MGIRQTDAQLNLKYHGTIRIKLLLEGSLWHYDSFIVLHEIPSLFSS
jgi:hypothetical protein